MISFKNKNMLRTLEPQNRVRNKNAEAHFKNPCSYKMKSVYMSKYNPLVAKTFSNQNIYLLI